jgi:hypothetical protein
VDAGTDSAADDAAAAIRAAGYGAASAETGSEQAGEAGEQSGPANYCWRTQTTWSYWETEMHSRLSVQLSWLQPVHQHRKNCIKLYLFCHQRLIQESVPFSCQWCAARSQAQRPRSPPQQT